MKRVLSIVVLFTAILISGNSFAQKSGHIDTQALLTAMPERQQAQAELQKAAKEYQNQIEEMQVEYNKKYQDYAQGADSLSNLIRQTKEQELMELQQRIQAFQQNAQKELADKETQLFQPIMDKAKKAIQEIGKENKLLYIYDSSTLLYISDQSVDILPLVKKKLGIAG